MAVRVRRDEDDDRPAGRGDRHRGVGDRFYASLSMVEGASARPAGRHPAAQRHHAGPGAVRPRHALSTTPQVGIHRRRRRRCRVSSGSDCARRAHRCGRGQLRTEHDVRDSVDTVRSSYDAVVVGARCAGAATARLLARAGLTVLLVEQGLPGADTLSTLALMRAGVLQLSRWGLLDAIEAAETPRIETTTFHYGNDAVEIPIKPRDGVDALYAPRRTLLDPLLADAAQASGAEVAYRVRLKDLRRNMNGRVTGVVVEGGGVARTIGATIVIGADGVNS